MFFAKVILVENLCKMWKIAFVFMFHVKQLFDWTSSTNETKNTLPCITVSRETHTGFRN